MFENIQNYPGDAILSLMEDFAADQRSSKVNLSIGFYYDESGAVPVLDVVKDLLGESASASPQVSLYLPMEGDSLFRAGVNKHLFRNVPDADVDRIATVQTVGGSSALRVGADFLKKQFPDSQVWFSDPTWDNHLAIFAGAGFECYRYPYLNTTRDGVDFDAMRNVLDNLPAHTIILLHACCHNPTGVDLTPAQWADVYAICKKRELIPFLDAAYVGFGDGIDQDLASITSLVESGLTGFVTNSFSKVFSLYGERVGSLSVVCKSSDISARVLGQLKATIRSSYSTPPRYGAAIVANILNSDSLRSSWEQEVKWMRLRMIAVRQGLQDRLADLAPGRDWSYLTKQKGMFSYTGMSPSMVETLRKEHAIYLINSGRMCVAGVNRKNIDVVASAIAKVNS